MGLFLKLISLKNYNIIKEHYEEAIADHNKKEKGFFHQQFL